jgi:pimeloyl-ACP methyl ester carboxylesterase
MKTSLKNLAASALFAAVLLRPSPGLAQIPPGCVIGQLPSQAQSLICVPAQGWNGALVVFAHGYVPVTEGPTFANLTLADGTFLPTLVQSLGYAFATTTYRFNGLNILEGVDDIKQLVAAFTGAYGPPSKTYATGVSEGGLVTALLAERSPALFTSALAACGPIGNFQAQINYFDDFRVLFDYFFPGVIPGTAIQIPDNVIQNWTNQYVPAILDALASNPVKALEMLKTARAPFDPANPVTIAQTTTDVLFYNVFASNNATLVLGGNPYGNRLRFYFGSSNDLKLNLSVARFSESPVARAALQVYETDGDPRIPLVTLHTTSDDVVPFTQELLYLLKLVPSAFSRFTPIPIVRYGHCSFTTNELLAAFQVTVR